MADRRRKIRFYIRSRFGAHGILEQWSCQLNGFLQLTIERAAHKVFQGAGCTESASSNPRCISCRTYRHSFHLAQKKFRHRSANTGRSQANGAIFSTSRLRCPRTPHYGYFLSRQFLMERLENWHSDFQILKSFDFSFAQPIVSRMSESRGDIAAFTALLRAVAAVFSASTALAQLPTLYTHRVGGTFGFVGSENWNNGVPRWDAPL